MKDLYSEVFRNYEPDNKYEFYHKLAVRTRSDDFTEALSFEVYDPLWMLGRQWQYGRFKGNDCGSVVAVDLVTQKYRIDGIELGGARKPFTADNPLEVDVEKRDHEIDQKVRIESACHFMKMANLSMWDAEFKKLLEKYPLSAIEPKGKSLEDLVLENNERQMKMNRYYQGRVFDGYKLYLDSSAMADESDHYKGVMEAYREWFRKKYLPIETGDPNCWNSEKLGYEVKMSSGKAVYEAEDYHTGRLSWYSFDRGTDDAKAEDIEPEPKKFTYIPTRATFPGAPSPHLWEFEDANVNMMTYSNKDLSEIASAVMVKFVTMYTNDWNIIPLETETGYVLTVEDIRVKDCFGTVFHIGNTPDAVDEKKDNVSFENRWAMFSNVRTDAYRKRNFSSVPGLFFPPSLNQTVEGNPIEEVQFLRDEMANMLWGVETRVSDGCGGSMDGRSLSDKVLGRVNLNRPYGQPLDGSLLLSRIADAFNKKGKDLAARIVAESMDTDSEGLAKVESEYSYLFMNRVPINWIPFIPQRVAGSVREIRFRRGRMPIWFNGGYNTPRPLTSLLKVQKKGEKTVPFFINEEEVLGYGTKVVLNAQRTRWFDGRIFTWRGYTKKISGYQANSGLMFDKLLDNADTKTVVLNAEDRKQEE